MNTNAKKIITIYGLLAAVLILFAIFQQFALVKVSATNAPKGTSVTYKTPGENNTSNMGLGLKLIKKGTYQFEASSGSELSRNTVAAKPFRINTVHLQLAPQKTAAKIASDTRACVYGDPTQLVKGNVYSYDCPSFTQPAYSNFSKQQSNVVQSFYNLSQTAPYGKGVIGLKKLGNYGEESEGTTQVGVEYVDETTDQTVVINDLGYNDDDTTKFAVSGKKIFVLDKINQKLAVIDGFSKDAKAKIYDIELPADADKLVDFGAVGSKVFVYSVSLAGSETEGITAGQFTTLTVEGGISQSVINIKDRNLLENILGDFTPLSSDTIAMHSNEFGGSIIIFKVTKNSLKKIDEIAETTDIRVQGDKQFILSNDGRVFLYNGTGKGISMAFGSSYSQIGSIRENEAGLVLKGKTTQTDTSQDITFLLGTGDYNDSLRLADFLPYKLLDNGVPTVLIDYLGKTIVATISPLALQYNSEQAIHDTVESYLATNKVNLSEYQLIYR